MNLSDTVTPTSDVLAKEVGGEIVLLSLSTGTYFGLSDVGMRAWQLLAEENRSVAALCDALESEYAVDRATLEQDVLSLCADLEAKGLIAAGA